MTKWLYRFWLVSVGVVFFQTLYYWIRLPERMASHFDIHGNPDSWSSTDGFMIMWLFAILVINVWPATIGPLIRKLPPSLVNTPNREYWLGSETRRERFIEITRAMIGGCIGGANVMLVLGLYYTYRVNMTGEGYISIWVGLAIELVITVFVIVWGIRKLRSPEDLSVAASSG